MENNKLTEVIYIDDDGKFDEAFHHFGLWTDYNKSIVAVDTETTGLDPHTSKLRLIQLFDGEKVLVINHWKISKTASAILAHYLQHQVKKLVFHNAVFDIQFLKLHLGIEKFGEIYCTMIGSQLLNFGDSYIKNSLYEVAIRELGVFLDKTNQRSDWSKQDLSDDQIQYAADDVTHLLKIRESQIQKLAKNKMIECAKIEMRCLEVTAEIELNGIKLDEKKWRRNYDRNVLRRHRMNAKISNMLMPNSMLFDDIPAFNVDSDQQLKAAMKKIGIPIPKMTDKKTGIEKETLNIDSLEKYRSAHPVIPMIIKASKISKLCSGYGMNWISHINPSTKRIHADIRQIGTMTARYTFKNPALQTIPQEDIIRKNFIAEEGYEFVWGDFSQIELRILAELSGDVNMIKAFREGLDLHTNTASLVFEVPYDKVSSIQRQRSKNLNFGIVYGIGGDRFALNAGISLEEAEEMINGYFAAYPQLHAWLNWAKSQGRNFKRSYTMSGRLIKYNFSDDDKVAASMAGRNGSNTPIQGSSADITKIALRNVFDATYGLARIVHCIHDEIVTEVKKEHVQEVKDLMRTAMVSAGEVYLKKVPVVVDIKSHYHWKK